MGSKTLMERDNIRVRGDLWKRTGSKYSPGMVAMNFSGDMPVALAPPWKKPLNSVNHPGGIALDALGKNCLQAGAGNGHHPGHETWAISIDSSVRTFLKNGFRVFFPTVLIGREVSHFSLMPIRIKTTQLSGCVGMSS